MNWVAQLTRTTRITTKIQSTSSATHTRKKQLGVASLVNWLAKQIWNSYLIKWSAGEKEQDRQDEEATVVADTQKRKMLSKTRRSIQSSQYSGLSHSFKSI